MKVQALVNQICLVLLSGLLSTAVFAGAVSERKIQTPKAEISAVGTEAGNKYYGTLEFRHHLNSYYDDDGFLNKQEPSVQTRIQAGYTAYQGAVDVYATLGIIKYPKTQRVVQRRPEIELDWMPVKGQYGWLLFYNLLKLPHPATGPDDVAVDADQAGTEFDIGFAPLIKYPFTFNGSKITFKAAGDVATKLFSRRQYVNETEDNKELYLSARSSDEISNSEPIEDYAQHYFSQVMTAIQLSPSYLTEGTFEVGSFVDSKYKPEYRVKDDQLIYEYGVNRTSHYRLRFSYRLSSNITLLNDFYHYFEGAFSSKTVDESRRYRNIARVSVAL